MPVYTVKQAEKIGDKPDKGYGPMQSIRLELQEYGQAEATSAEWYTKATTAIPLAGSTIEGDIKPGQYGPQFKKAQQAGGFGGGRGGRSPEETKAIVRQHSQAMALQYAAIRQAQGELPAEKFTLENLWKLVDQFDADVARAKARPEGQA